ncbi:MAG: peptidase M1 [Haliscomenobacter sp.]|nr:peptidase M1 [Haliscomenobacter sp.]
MNRFRLFHALVGCVFFSQVFFAPLSAQEEDIHCKTEFNLPELEGRTATRKLAFRAAPHTSNYDLKYHRLEWTVDPAVFFIRGAVTSYFVPSGEGFQTIQFDLYSGLRVVEATRNGKALTFIQHNDDRLEVRLGETLLSGKLDSVTVRYEGAPRRSAFGSFSQGTHNNVPVIWTLSEPYGALDWWPCKQSLDDKIDSIDVLVRTPQMYRAASNGVLVAETATGTDKVYHWKHRYPIPAYLIAIGVTNYAVYSDFVPVEGRAPIDVLNYVYPERLSTFKTQTPATVEIMKLFNQLYGLYPFADEKYGHAQFGFGGGMEHQTMSFMGGFSHLLIAHELAHQWFGDKITCGSWSDIWLNEGFATYSEGLTYDFGLGTNTLQNWLQSTMSSARSQPAGSVFVEDTTSVNRIFSSALSYSKGAMLLHMLRGKLGDDVFFQGVRNYAADSSLAFRYARTPDLKKHLEAAGGQNLDEFFKDWFYGKGHPSYRVLWNQTGENVLIRINQTTSHTSVPFFEMPVQIQFKGKNGDTLMVFNHQKNGQDFSFNLPFAVEGVVVDPDLWILTGTKEAVFSAITGVRAPDIRNIQLWPNPASDEVFLALPEDVPQDALLFLFNQQGQLLRQMQSASSLPVGDLPPGLYQLILRSRDGAVWRGRFVKE